MKYVTGIATYETFRQKNVHLPGHLLIAHKNPAIVVHSQYRCAHHCRSPIVEEKDIRMRTDSDHAAVHSGE